MSTYRLDSLFSPRSIAVIGASPRDRSVGRAILKNLRDGGFAGDIHVINTRYPDIDGIRTVPRLEDLPAPPDLAVIAAPAQAVPDIVGSAAKQGIGSAVIITAGLGHGPGSLASACEQTARAKGLRLVGPNCLGVMVPRAKLNASFAARMPPAGDLALISQSGAVAAGMIDWAAGRSTGFSAVVSIGDQLDVDFGDLLDYFALDTRTRAILLYIELIKDARKFMSAARAAARVKPVIVIKAGRHAEAARAAATHTGALAGTDDVYDAAFRRAGLLRVMDLGELFNAAETLGRLTGPIGKRLAILTNGGGIGVLAIDRLIDLGGTPAEISAATKERLDAVAAADLVAVESDRHHWRRRSRPICGRARSAAGRRRGRCSPRHECRDRFGAGDGHRENRRRHRMRAASGTGCDPSRSWRHGSGTAPRSPRFSIAPMFRVIRPKRMRSAASCTSSATATSCAP